LAVNAQGRADFSLDPPRHLGVVAQRGLGIFPALTEPFALVGKPRAGFFVDLVFNAEVNDLARPRNALAVHDVELGFPERRRDLVLGNFHLGAIADEFFAVLDLADAADVNAHRGVKFERPPAGGRFRRPEHDPDLLANLVDEDQTGVRAADDRRQLAQRLRHQPRLQTRQAVAHVAFEFGAWGQRRDRVNDHDVNRVRAHQRFADFERLLAGIRLRDEQVVDAHTELFRVDRIQRVFGVNVSGNAAGLLRLGHHVQRERGFAGAFRTVDFDDATARHPADADGGVHADARR